MTEDKSEATIERNVYERPDGKWGWRLKVNGKIVATDGAQGYDDEDICRKMADRVVKGYYAEAKRTTSRNTPKD